MNLRMLPHNNIRFGWIYTVILITVLAVSACVPTHWEQPAWPDDEAHSEKDNNSYDVFGKRYMVLQSSYGYKERGVASWYGNKFHGNPTASGEIYDMYGMTAAHKTLPLPTTVKVTNLSNARSVIVIVNDRGPFVQNRIIDLSYSAARKLDMIRAGTAQVEISAVASSSAGHLPISESTEIVVGDTAVTAKGAEQPATVGVVPMLGEAYLQAGAFGKPINAKLLKDRLQSNGLDDVRIHYVPALIPALYRVRIGPFETVDEYDKLVEQLKALNIMGAHLVVEPSATPSQTFLDRGSNRLPDG